MYRFGKEDPKEFRKENLRSKKTEDQTKFAVKMLVDFINDRNSEIDVIECRKADLAKLFEDFYSNIRNKKGEFYKKNTALAIRQSLNRYMKENGRSFDIITDPEFTQANNNFTSMLRKIRDEGKGTVAHHQAIKLEDLKRLYDHSLAFNIDTPQGLLNKTVFEIILYFCRRGQENLADLKVSDFQIIVDGNGQKFVQKTTSELTKNHQGTTNEEEGSGGKMYATGTSKCPVSSLEKYLSKRNTDSDRLFLHPKNSFWESDDVWYRNEPLGRNTLRVFMKNLSKFTGLSQEYTNHCIRSTCITLLDYCGFQSRHIMTISGHRNEQSLSSYCYDTSDQQKKSMSDALSSCTGGKGALVPIQNLLAHVESRTISLSQEITQATIHTVTRTAQTKVEPRPSIVETDPDIIDFLNLPDDAIVEFIEAPEKSVNSLPVNINVPAATNANVPAAPNFNISNCTVNINYYNH